MIAMQSRFMLTPFHLLVTCLAAWINREQLKIIEYLRAENRVLRELMGKRRLLLNDDQRRRLAVKGQALGRKLLGEVGTLFTPDTILRWHRNWSLRSGITQPNERLWGVRPQSK